MSREAPAFRPGRFTTWNDIQAKTFSTIHIGKTEIRASGITVEALSKRLQGRVLDVGCGDGGIVAILKKAGFEAEGLDFPQVAQVARQRHPDCLFYEGSVEQMARWHDVGLGSIYGTAICLDVIEHVEDDLGLIRSLGEVAPRVIITTPSHPHKWREQEEHLRFYVPVALARLIAIAGMVLVEHLIVIEEDTGIFVAERSDLPLEERLKRSVEAAKDPAISMLMIFSEPVPQQLVTPLKDFLDYFGETEVKIRSEGKTEKMWSGRRK